MATPYKYLYETHMHTSPVSACADSTPAEQVRAYERGGYAGIIVTDHFINGNCGCPRGLPWVEKMKFFISGYERAKKEGDRCGLDVFFGLEFSVNGADLLTYGLDPQFLFDHPDIDRLPVEEYVALVRGAGGYIAQAHPFRVGPWIDSPFPISPTLLDGMEVFNASMPPYINKKAFDFAKEHKLPIQAGSDSHFAREASASGVALVRRAKSIFDIINAIKGRRVELIIP